MLGREKNPEKNSADSSATPLRTGMFQSRPFSDPTVSDEVSPHKQELPDLQTQLERGAHFSQSLSRMKVYGNRPAIQPKIAVGAPGDKYEQEADQMAQQVMSMPAAVTHPPIQRLEMQEEEKEPVQTKPLAASITPLVQRETAPAELEEEQEPVQMKRSLEETAEVSIQRDGTDALPALPNYQLTPPSLLQPPDPSSRYGLGQNFQLHLDPQFQAMAFQHVQQQMEPATIRAALSQVNLGLTALPAPSASRPTATPTPNPFATPSPSPAAPLVPRGAGPDTPRPATAGDLMSALLAVPAIDTWITTLQTRATEQIMRDWRRLSTGEQVGAVSSAVAIGAGALAGILSDPNAREMALSQLNGRVLPVPGLNWLSLEINTEGNNLMLGGHVDIGRLLPPSLGFGPSSAQPIGGPPTPQPFVPGQPSVQREATPEAEEEKVQMKPLANAMIQREAMPEEKEKVQTKPLLQRASEGGSFQASSDIESQLSTSKGGGSSLPDEVRSFMEPRIGADFGSVRVHTDSEAVQMNQDLNAQAFTHGSDIYFGAGKYNPGSSDGKRLLAHELTHVVQQTGSTQTSYSHVSRMPGGSGGESDNAQGTGTVTWLDLPHAGLKKGATKGAKKGGKPTLTAVENKPNIDPTLAYAPEDQMDFTSARDEQIEDSVKEQIVSDIVAARNAIPPRDIGRSPYGDPVGNFHDPALAKNDPIAAQYNQWSKGAVPTQRFDPANADAQKKWQIFQKTMVLEGRVGTITTFDKTLTIGVGFSSAGRQAEQIIGKIFDALPEVNNLAFRAGLQVDKKKKSLSVVDTDHKWILEGTDASNYVQTNKALLSLLINVSQGSQTYQSEQALSDDESTKQRQTMLDAQWTTFLDNALKGIPDEVLQWPLDSVVFATHTRHAIENTFPWTFWTTNNNTDLKAMVRALYQQLKATDKMVWLYPICGGIYKPYADQVQAEEEGPDFYKKLNGLQMSDMLKELRKLAAQKLKIRLNLYDSSYRNSYGGRPHIAMLAVLNRKSSKADKLSIVTSSDFTELPEEQQQLIRKELGLN